MAACQWLEKVDRWFDGEHRDDAPLKDHLASCAACREHLRGLEWLRTGMGAVVAHPEIQDAQMPAFLAGIRDGIDKPQRHWRGLWAYMSLAAAALIVAVSTLMLLPGGSDEAMATVESAVTELKDGQVHVDVRAGTTTIWVEVGEHRDIQ
jgi:hypothetical protein